MEKRKPTANHAADCIDMVLPRHATIYLNTKQLGLVPLLNISTTYLEIERWAGKSTAFLQSCKEYRFSFGSVEWQLLSAQVDTVLATSFNWVLTEVIEGPQRKDIGKVLIIKVGNNYHNNHDSSYHQWLNDLVIWNIWRVQDYK